MTDETLDVSPAPGADDVPVESPTTTDEAADKQPTDDAGSEPAEQPRDERGRFTIGKVQKRIDEVTWEKHEALRERDYYRGLYEQSQKPPAAKPEPEALTPPTLESVGYDETKYQRAVLEYATQRALAAVDARLNERTEQEAAQRRQQTFASRQAEFAKTVEDYDTVVRNPSLAITANMAEDIAESENGPALAYYLGKNPDVARAIAALPARAASRELGKIEAKLTAPKPPPAPSKAPPPPPKIAASEPDVEKDPDKMSVDEWKAWREKQLRKKG